MTQRKRSSESNKKLGQRQKTIWNRKIKLAARNQNCQYQKMGANCKVVFRYKRSRQKFQKTRKIGCTKLRKKVERRTKIRDIEVHKLLTKERNKEKKYIRAVDRGTQGAVMRPAKVKKKWGNKNHFKLI